MAVPAEVLPSRRPVPGRVPPRRGPAGPAARPRTPSPPHPLRRARRGSHLAFWLLAAVVVTGLVVSIVSVSAFVVQTGFRIDATERRIAELSDRREALRRQVAQLSAPNRIARWARSAGFVVPEEVVVLPVPSPGAGG